MSSVPFMQLYVSDYLSDTLELTTEQHGAYLLLLMTMWRSGGALKNDGKKLCRIVRISPSRWHLVWPHIEHFFYIDGDEIRNSRLDKEYEKAVSISAKRTEAGRAGGVAKSLKEKGVTIAKAMDEPWHSHNTEPDTEVKRDTNVSPKKPTPFDELISVIDKERARDVIDHRNKIKKPMTSKAAKMLAAKLAEFDDPNKAADFMIEKGWVSIEKDWVRNAMTNGARGSPPPQQSNGKPRNIAEASTQLLAQMRAENANTQSGTSHSLLEPNVPRLASPIRQFGPE